jgi:hypothetical protein
VANVEEVGGVNGEATAHILPPVDGLRNTRAVDKSTRSSTPLGRGRGHGRALQRQRSTGGRCPPAPTGTDGIGPEWAWFQASMSAMCSTWGDCPAAMWRSPSTPTHSQSATWASTSLDELTQIDIPDALRPCRFHSVRSCRANRLQLSQSPISGERTIVARVLLPVYRAAMGMDLSSIFPVTP